MGKLTQDEIRTLALEAAKTITADNKAPFFNFDAEVAKMYARYIRAKEAIEKEESKE